MKLSTADSKNSYAGMMSRQRQKYADCKYVEVFGKNRVRLLSPIEIDEFKARINQIIDPSLRVMSKFRRSVS